MTVEHRVDNGGKGVAGGIEVRKIGLITTRFNYYLYLCGMLK
jgi:hypothetical protein